MRHAWVILLLPCLVTCREPPERVDLIEQPKKWTVSGWCTLLDIENQDADEWSPLKGAGPLVNRSAYGRSFEQSKNYLRGFDSYVATLSDHDLIEMLAKTDRSYNRAEYWVALNGNKIITEELCRRRERGPLEVDGIGDYEGVSLYTGPSGPIRPMYLLLRHLLHEDVKPGQRQYVK